MPAAWNPADARRRLDLTLSAADRAAVEANFAPLARADGRFDADAVFEGGGVLGTAFLGAARLCDDVGVRWHALAGTSAGAITAALLAADLNIDQLEQAVGRLDYLSLLSQKTSRLVFNGDPGDDLDHPALLLTNLALAGELGEYGTDPLRDWLDEALRWPGKQTFGDVWDRGGVPDRQLKVVVSDLSRGEMRVLPDDLEQRPAAQPGQARPPAYRPPLTARQRAFPVAEAVRLSMSIPFFFAPGTLDNPDGSRSVVVDGGILSNFPLWIYDEDVPGRPPAWPTFGFRLVDSSATTPAPIDSVTGLFAAMLRTMMLASDRRYLSQRHLGRVIDVDLAGLGLTATQFGLTDAQKDALYARGYEAARRFFVERWSWRDHLARRGYPPAGSGPA
jgi:NTE family protein